MAVKPVVLSAVDRGTRCGICGDRAERGINGLLNLCRECLLEIVRQWNRN